MEQHDRRTPLELVFFVASLRSLQARGVPFVFTDRHAFMRLARFSMLDASVEALVNTVNEVGVMGKGVASMFREKYPAKLSAVSSAPRGTAKSRSVECT